MEFALDPTIGAPISGGVVRDSLGNIISADASSYLAPTYSQINSFNKAKSFETSSPGVLDNSDFAGYSIDSNGNLQINTHNDSIQENTANEVINDYTRGETSNLETSKDYLERLTGIIANGIYTAKEQNALNLQDAERTREYNALEAEKARAFQLMMRDSQIQSTMKQLKDAGINPLLALSGSLGYANASSPAQASSSHTSYGNDNSIMSALIIAVASTIGNILKALTGGISGEYSYGESTGSRVFEEITDFFH